jgi:hypothetical protein
MAGERLDIAELTIISSTKHKLLQGDNECLGSGISHVAQLAGDTSYVGEMEKQQNLGLLVNHRLSQGRSGMEERFLTR